MVSEEDLEDIAEGLRECTEEAMRIEIAPWLSYTVQMKDLYTELTVEKIENKPTGPESKMINDYKELFDQAQESDNKRKGRFKKRRKGKRFLVKADLGLGKTTFCKKVAWDWAKGHLANFSIVFFVRLKFVKPNQSVESIILQSYPCLKSQNVREGDVRQLLDRFGDRCLILLDGF